MIDLIEPRLLINNVAKKLESKIEMPEWAKFVKTGSHKQRPPVDANWWYLRAAAILRTIDLKGPVGVAKLRTKYGGKKNLGAKPEHFVKGSGKIIRVILQQLEAIKLVEKAVKGNHKGRVTTPAGKALLYGTSKEVGVAIKKATPEEKPKKVEAKPEVKENSKKVETKFEEAKVESKVDAKAEVKKVDVKVEETPEVKVEAKVEAKVETKVETKVEEVKEVLKKVDVKVEEKPEVKVEVKSEVKVEEKVEAKKESSEKKVE